MKMALLTLAALALTSPLAAQAQAPGQAQAEAEQREKLAVFAWMDGTWRGDATVMSPAGSLKIVQTERVGPMLGGAARVIEGRAYGADGKLVFNAFAVVSWNRATKAYEIHAWNGGRVGVFPIVPRADGYDWETPMGPAKIVYRTTFKDGVWRETGSYEAPGRPPMTVVDMTLRRIGDTDWPLATPVGPK